MRNNNGRLIAVVASVAVAAVAIGAALAYRQGPQTAQADAAPLTSSPSPTTPTPSASTSTPAATPSAVTLPTKINLTIAKLPQGREPQVPYLVGREVRGGSADPQKIPGKGSVVAVGRLQTDTLAIVMYEPDGDGTELLRIRSDGSVTRRTPNVSSLVTTPDQTVAAYAAAHISSLGIAVKGGTVYAETGESLQSLKVPEAWNLEVISYTDGKVFYRAGDKETGPRKLYSWVPSESEAQLIKSVVSPTAISAGGNTAASMGTITDDGTCSNVVRLPAGTQLFRTCEYAVDGFTPSGVNAYGGPAHRDGFCDGLAAAFDATSGKLLHEWKGCFQAMAAEDDQHVLAVAYASPAGQDTNVKTAIIRCAITTGACELATPIGTDTPLVIGS